MLSNLIVATLVMLGGALDTLDALVRGASRWMSAAFLLTIDIWVIVIIIGCIVIVIIVIVIRTSRRK